MSCVQHSIEQRGRWRRCAGLRRWAFLTDGRQRRRRNHNGLFALLTRRGPLCMSKSDKYQRFAEECLEIAQTAKDNQAKAVLLHMAQVWFRLAAEHAEHAKGG